MHRLTIRLVVVAGLFTVLTATGRAAEYTWTGGWTTQNWSEAANWVGTVPASDLANTQIRLAGTTGTATVLDPAMPTSGSPAAFELNRLTFASDSGPFSISWGSASGPPLRLGGGGIVVESGNASNLAINVPLSVSGTGSHTWVHDGTGLLTVGGSVTIGGPAVSIGGSGDYAFTGAISGNINGITFTGTGTKTLSGVNTYSGLTTILNGTVKLAGGSDRLPTGTSVRLGSATAPGTGTLDLNGRSQTILEVTTQNGDANNRVVSTAAGAIPTLTVKQFGTRTFDGTLGGAGGDNFGLQFYGDGTSPGSLTLSRANTYAGDTTVSRGTLKLTGTGSFANSRTITVGPTSSSGAQLDVTTGSGGSTLTGGANFDATTGRFALAAGQRLQGAGRGTLGGVTVRAGSVIQGGVDSAIGTLTVGGSSTVNAAAGDDGGTIRVYVRDNAGTVTSSRITISGASTTLDFANVGGENRFRIDLRDAGGLQMGKSYGIVLATAGGGFRRNGGTATFTTDDFLLTSPDVPSFTNVSLVDNGAELRLFFTPVPEPAAVLAVAGLGLAGLRRRWVSPGTT
jgi:autotransporter-associated beta strand protein